MIEVTVCEPWQCTASIVLSGVTSLDGGLVQLGRIALDTLSCLCSGGKPAPTRVFCLMASTKFVVEFNSERQSTTLFQAGMAYRLVFDGACVRCITAAIVTKESSPRCVPSTDVAAPCCVSVCIAAPRVTSSEVKRRRPLGQTQEGARRLVVTVRAQMHGALSSRTDSSTAPFKLHLGFSSEHADDLLDEDLLTELQEGSFVNRFACTSDGIKMRGPDKLFQHFQTARHQEGVLRSLGSSSIAAAPRSVKRLTLGSPTSCGNEPLDGPAAAATSVSTDSASAAAASGIGGLGSGPTCGMFAAVSSAAVLPSTFVQQSGPRQSR